MLLFFISFVAGVLTVLAPCILPILPVIVGGSVAGQGNNRKKTFTIIFSLGLSVIAFTLLLKASTLLIDIPTDLWKWFSGSIIFIIGIVMLFPSLWENTLLARLGSKSNILLGQGESKKSFWGDVIMGTALGPVFSSCSPTYFVVIATVLPASPILGIIYLFAYALGLCLALLVIALVGQKIMDKLGVVADPKGWFKKTLGVIFMVVGVAIIGGFDKKAQTFLLDAGFFDVTRFERSILKMVE